MQADTATVVIGESRDAARRASRPGRWFFPGLALAATIAVLLGFARTYYLKSLLLPQVSFPLLFHLHGALFTVWFLLLVLQAALVALRKTALHRRVGRIGVSLVVPMLVTGCLVAIAAARGQAPIGAAVRAGEVAWVRVGIPPVEVLLMNLAAMLLFGMFAAAGLACRHRPDAHKRFMVLATIVLLPAAIGRAAITLSVFFHLALLFGSTVVFVLFGSTLFFVLAVAIYDRRNRGGVHPVTLWGGLALVLSFPGRVALAKTELWLTVATWLIR